jgi:hypothetical protein
MMTIELDHFFILTDPGAPHCDLVSSIGLIEGSRNSHPGQGTANRRFFFSNSTLEFIYLRDADEASQGRGSRLRFAERASSTRASPFGLVMRMEDGSGDEPFPGWRYCPEYFRDDQCFHVGENSVLLEEPLCICMPTNLPRREIRSQSENPQWTMTELRISVPVARPSAVLKSVEKCESVTLQLNKPHRLDLVFNDNKEGLSKDMTLDLPLVIHW